MKLTHVVESQQFTVPLLMELFERARLMERVAARGGTLDYQHRIMATLFYEPSTRTRFSFEAAMHRLGGRVLATEQARQIVILGEPGDPATQALHAVVARRYLPHAVVVPAAPGAPQASLAARLPYVAAMTLRDGRPTAYVCLDFTCREPVTTPSALDAALGRA